MSKELGPIHYLMYEKIKFQDELASYLLKDEKVLSELNLKFPPVYSRNLDEIIDKDNIHGWLAYHIDIVELRLAFAFNYVKDVLSKIYEFAKNIALKSKINKIDNADELYEIVNKYLLDGMPCDYALSVESNDETNLELITLINTHDKYQKYPSMIDPNLSLSKTCSGQHDHQEHETFKIKKATKRADLKSEVYSLFYQARESFLKGLLVNSNWSVIQTKEGHFSFNKKV